MTVTRKAFLKNMAGLAVAGGLSWPAGSRFLEAREAAGGPSRRTRIVDAEFTPFDMPLKQIFRTALGAESVESEVLVRLRTADGRTGWGEASPYWAVTSETQATNLALAKDLTAFVRDRDPFTVARILGEMDAFSPGNPSIKAAFEMALWDLCGKIAGQPVYRLLGGYRDSFATDATVSLDEPATMAEGARRIAGQGFKSLKVKVGEGPEKDIERVAAVREAAGAAVEIRIDANQGWSPSDAIRALRGMEKYRLQLCEQPVPYWDWEGLKHVRENASVPIMADESVHSPHDAITAARMEAVDMINIKLMKSGGILPGLRIAEIAGAAGMKCMAGCMGETRLALTAGAHLVAAGPSIVFADLDSALLHAEDPVVGGMQIKEGTVHLPDAPGLGLDIDPGFLSRLRKLN
jgi:L-Ala-D/L-Glu epimerase